jgi:hypothetical protein
MGIRLVSVTVVLIMLLMLILSPAIAIITSAASNNDFNALRNFNGHG